MSLALVVTDRDVRPLQQRLQTLLGPQTPVWVFPDIPDPAAVEMAVLWKHPPGLLRSMPRLKLISSLGAGVEHLMNDPDLPPGLPVTRIVEEALTVSMRNYALMAVLNIHRHFRFFQENQRQNQWVKPDPVERPMRIGVLGMGALGGDIARHLALLGFETWGYSRRPQSMEGVHCRSGQDEPLEQFVQRINTLICVLPRTAATENILNYSLFRHLPPGSALINVARGGHLVEEDLLRALEEGLLTDVYLDVFREEPLPSHHAFWQHPAIVITPHIASVTNQENAAQLIAENYRRLKQGIPLLFQADPGAGY